MSVSDALRAKIKKIENAANQYAEESAMADMRQTLSTAYKAGALETTLELLAMHIDIHGDEKLKKFLKSRWE